MIQTMIQLDSVRLLTVADIEDMQRVAALLPDEPEDPEMGWQWDAWLDDRLRPHAPPSRPVTTYGAWLPPEARRAMKRVLMAEDDVLLLPTRNAGGWRSLSEIEIVAARSYFTQIVLDIGTCVLGGASDAPRITRLPVSVVPSLDAIAADPGSLNQLPLDVLLDLRRKTGIVTVEVDVAIARRMAQTARQEPSPEPDRLLSGEEAARIAGVTPSWLIRHTSTLPFVRKLSHKVVRYSEPGLRRWLANRRP